jgi:hypothetical protein
MTRLRKVLKEVRGRSKSDQPEKLEGKPGLQELEGVRTTEPEAKIGESPREESGVAGQSVEVCGTPPPTPKQLPVTVEKRRQNSLLVDIGSSGSSRQAEKAGDVPTETVPRAPSPLLPSTSTDKQSLTASSSLEAQQKDTSDGRATPTSLKNYPTSHLPSESEDISKSDTKPRTFRKYDPQKSLLQVQNSAISLYLQKNNITAPSSIPDPEHISLYEKFPYRTLTPETPPQPTPIPELKVTVIGTDDSPENWSQVFPLLPYPPGFC